MGTDLRHLEIMSQKKDLVDPNRQIWQSLGIKQTDTALFFPTPNVLVPIAFAKFMNKRKVTFVDSNEINVSTLISLAAELKLSNVTVKLASPFAKFPIADNAVDVIYSDWGYSGFPNESHSSFSAVAESLTKELVRIIKPEGKIASLDENGAPVMYPCPPDIQATRSKIDSQRVDRLTAGRRVYGLLKSSGIRNIKLTGYSRFLTKENEETLAAELNRRILSLDTLREQYTKSGLTPQEIDKYKQWLRGQISNESFLIQFNSILTVGQK